MYTTFFFKLSENKYPDGRLIPKSGDEVFIWGKDMMGPKLIFGVVKGKQVIITSAGANKSTVRLTPQWSVVDDPWIKKDKEEKEIVRKNKEKEEKEIIKKAEEICDEQIKILQSELKQKGFSPLKKENIEKDLSGKTIGILPQNPFPDDGIATAADYISGKYTLIPFLKISKLKSKDPKGFYYIPGEHGGDVTFTISIKNYSNIWIK